MQIGGVGGNHSADLHQVTNCLHDHAQSHKTGGAAGSSGAVMNAQLPQAEVQQDAQFSLSAWLEKTLGNGKRMLRSFWGSSEANVSGESGGKSDHQQIMAQIHDDSTENPVGANMTGQEGRQSGMSQTLHTPQIAAAATAVTEPQTLQNNPYFAAVEEIGKEEETIWQKMRVKFRDITGQLSGHLPGKFLNFQTKSSFQEKEEQKKEDLRKRSKFRKDEVEIDCVLTDDSYLLDSYDRKGGYSRLSTKK